MLYPCFDLSSSHFLYRSPKTHSHNRDTFNFWLWHWCSSWSSWEDISGRQRAGNCEPSSVWDDCYIKSWMCCALSIVTMYVIHLPSNRLLHHVQLIDRLLCTAGVVVAKTGKYSHHNHIQGQCIYQCVDHTITGICPPTSPSWDIGFALRPSVGMSDCLSVGRSVGHTFHTTISGRFQGFFNHTVPE